VSNSIHSINLINQERNYECSEKDSVLKSGLRNGLNMRYECSNGTCGVCKAKLISGDLEQIKHHDFALSNDEIENGEFLTCCNAPKSDLSLELDLIGDVRSIPVQNIETKVKSVSFINDLAVVNIRTPRSKTLQFMAGQDVELEFNGIKSRYPIASCPCNGMELEFHIRSIESDEFSQAVFSKKIKPKAKLNLTGPKGVFVLREDSVKPMLFIAWDGGFAPIRSLVEHAFSLEMPNPVYFYWAYPTADQFPYLDKHAKSWSAIFDNYQYKTIACEFDRSSKNDCHKVAKQIYDCLDKDIVNLSDIYISAPAEVLIYLSEILLKNGVHESQIIGSPI